MHMKKNIVKILLITIMVTIALGISVYASNEPPEPKIITPIVEVI
jgi:hypothetical protein